MTRRAVRARVHFVIGLIILISAVPAFSQTIGLYADESGNTCSFTGDAQGLVTGYVVFRPRPDGATAVQFAGPVPPCFGGNFIDATSQFTKLGTFTTGISIAFGYCATGGLNVLTVNFFRAGGATAPCCAYPLVNDPAEQNILAADCNFELYNVSGITSYFNANAQCECFTSDVPPTVPSDPNPADNATNVHLTPKMTWVASDVDGDLAEYDLYLGTTPTPPLVAPGLTTSTYTPAPLAPLTQHYWKVVARDDAGHETAGPIWTFTTRLANAVPLPPSNPDPSDGEVGVLDQGLSWTCSDADGDPLTYDVYFGTSTPPPLVASDLPTTQYGFFNFSPGVQYYWRVVADDGGDETSSPTWTFTSAAMGDVNGDGVVTVDDASCALQLSVIAPCGGTGSGIRADVNCDQFLGALDARCIHKNVVEGSCAFCGETASAAPGEPLLPALSVSPSFVAYNGEIGVYVYVSGVQFLRAFLFRLEHDTNVTFLRAIRYGVTIPFEGLASAPSLLPGLIPASVAGYTVGGVQAISEVGLVELRFSLTAGSVGHATITNGFDDIFGGHNVPILLLGPPLPVLISSFETIVSGAGVEVSWELSTDEPLGTFSLYRRTSTQALPVVVAQGDANDIRSFVDRTVHPATTYHYELVIHTQGGEEYRSPVKTVTTAELALSLRQNHPNPFNPTTTISFDIPGAGTTPVRLSVYDAAGRLVRTLVNESMPGGSHAVEWNGRDERGNAASSGVYFYVLDAGKERLTRKMVLLK